MVDALPGLGAYRFDEATSVMGGAQDPDSTGLVSCRQARTRISTAQKVELAGHYCCRMPLSMMVQPTESDLIRLPDPPAKLILLVQKLPPPTDVAA